MGNALVVGLVEQMGQVLQEGPAVVSQEQPDEVGALGYDD